MKEPISGRIEEAKFEKTVVFLSSLCINRVSDNVSIADFVKNKAGNDDFSLLIVNLRLLDFRVKRIA